MLMHNSIVLDRRRHLAAPRLSRRWTPALDAILIEMIGKDVSIPNIALALKRTLASIQQRRHKLERRGKLVKKREREYRLPGCRVHLEDRPPELPEAEERLRSRCRQLAAALASGGMTWRGLLRSGWVANYVKELLAGGGVWFEVDAVFGVALTDAGRAELLGVSS